MTLSIIMGVIIAAIVVAIALRFRNENVGIITIVLCSVLAGAAVVVLNNYLVPTFPNLAWLFLLITVTLIGALVFQWSRQGSDLVEFICFAALTLIIGWIAKAAAACYTSVFPMLVAVIVPIVAIGYYGFTALKFHRDRYLLKDEEREKLDEDTVEEMDYEATRFGRWMIVVGVATIIFLGTSVGLTLALSENGNVDSGVDEPEVSMTEDTGSNLDSRFVQEWTENENNRLDSEFAAKLAKKAEAEDGTITPEIVQETVLENCGHDARMLAIWANAFGLRDNPNEYEDLLTEDKTYLSNEGISLYNKVEGYLAATAVTREEAPSDGINSGYNDDGYVAAESAGITGDRSGTKFVSPDKSVEEFWLMDRCSNLVYKGTPKAPSRGDTDEPSKPKKTPTKKPSEDPVNKGNAKKGGGQNKPSDGAGEKQNTDPRKENPTGSKNDNGHGYAKSSTVTPPTPPVVEEHKKEKVKTDQNKMDYKPDPVTKNGPADSSKKPTSSEGDGEFTPSD